MTDADEPIPPIPKERRPAEDRDECLPAEVRRLLRQLPHRLRSMQIGGIWVGGFLLGVSTPTMPCLLGGVMFVGGRGGGPFLLALAWCLVLPICSYLVFRGASQLQERPIRAGLFTTAILTLLALFLDYCAISVISTSARFDGRPAPFLGILLVVVALFTSLVALDYLRSLRLLLRFSHAQIEHPVTIHSLWSSQQMRENRQRLKQARLHSFMSGFLLVVLPFLFLLALQ